MKTWFIPLFCIVFCLTIGYVGSLFQAESMYTQYPTLQRSVFTPPGYAFPIVWTILYIFIGLALAYILLRKPANQTQLVFLWAVQMILNFLWSILFFYLQHPILGFIDIVVLDIAVLFFIKYSFKSARIASLLFIPYMVWLVLATYLNGYIMLNN